MTCLWCEQGLSFFRFSVGVNKRIGRRVCGTAAYTVHTIFRVFFLKILFPPLHYRQLLDHFSFFVEKTSWGIIVFGRKRATRYLLFHHSLPSLTCTRARATSSVFGDPFQSCYSAVVRLTPRTETTIV